MTYFATAGFGHRSSGEWTGIDLAAVTEPARPNRATHAWHRGAINRPKARTP